MNEKTARRANKIAKLAARATTTGERHAALRKLAQVTRVPRAYGLMPESGTGSFDTYA